MTQELKHTPGPWRLFVYDERGKPNYRWYWFIDTNTRRCVASSSLLTVTKRPGWKQEFGADWLEVRANMRLMAAAPEMLDALIEARDELYALAGEASGSGRYQSLDDAISKALTGE